MPIAVAPTSSNQPTNGISKDQTRTKKSRVVRRRARTRDLIDSDEEIEREVSSESDSNDAESSLGSDSESESELASDDVLPEQHYSVITPSTTQSPPPADANDGAHVNGESSSKSAAVDSTDGIFVSGAVDWSEMVADEHRNGPADLPVIDFADLGAHGVDLSAPTHQQKSAKASKKSAASRSSTVPEAVQPTVAPSPPQPLQEDSPADDAHGPEEGLEEVPGDDASHPPPRTPFQRRPPGQTARQAYQRRLESDPSYVPVVGEFWGHDDRLLDKELRSLSGWWRGKWQDRGRGRGGMAMRGRGRGGFFGGRPTGAVGEKEGDAVRDESQLPPVERTWTHDGFEEMKRREEQRRGVREEQQRQQQVAQRGFGPFRGRGGFAPSRGRGGFFRGGLSPTPVRTRLNFSLPPASDRPRYAMKPEQPFTKRHEGYLHFEERALKPQDGVGQGYRVKLPGEQRQGGTIIRGPPRAFVSPRKIAPQSLLTPYSLEDDDKFVTVRLPKRRAGKEKAAEVDVVAVGVTVAEQAVEVSSQPSASAAFVAAESSSVSMQAQAGPSRVSGQSYTLARVIDALPEQIRAQISQTRTANAKASTVEYTSQDPAEQSVASLPAEPSAPQARPAPPVLPLLQTSFSPVQPTSPTFGSPYGYPQALPPGIAMTQHGMPYEVATGRPVYLQATPPPMYNPRPIMHTHIISPPMPFVPGHTPHHSLASPDFYSHSPSPSLNGFIDPVTGAPLFTLPRQSSRVEIRAPTDQSERKASHRPSTLRTTVVGLDSSATEDPSQSQQADGSSQPPPPEESAHQVNGDIPGQVYQVEPGVMMYNPYQQPYYYPEHYGYSPYMDMSQMPQYEMYPVEAPPPQQTVYY